MRQEEKEVFSVILEAIDTENFDEWFSSLHEFYHNGMPTKNYQIGKHLVSRELIFAVKASPNFYRKYLNESK